MAGQPQRASVRNVVAAKVLYRSAARELQLRRSSRQRHIKQNLSSPALVIPCEEFRELPKLRSLPLHNELQRSVTKSVRALPGAAHLQQARVVQIQVGTEGLRFQPHSPAIFRILPQGKVCIGQSVRFFLWSALEINPRGSGFN